MAGSRIPGPTGLNVPQATVDPFTLQPISPRGVLGQNDGVDFNQALESEKKEIILDITQLVLDITGIIDPAPISDGSNAILSLARARWTDALISAVSIIPYIGDLAKLGKLPRYLSSIRKAIRIAKTDPKWAMALRRLFITKVSEFISPSNKAYRDCFIKPQAEASLGQVEGLERKSIVCVLQWFPSLR